MIAAVSARIAPKQRPSLTDRRTFPSRGMRRGDGRRIARESAVSAPSLSSPATMCVNGNRVDPARAGLRDPHRREPELVRRRPDLHRLALDRLRRPVRPDDGLPHGRRLRGPVLPVAHAARARPRVGRAAQRDRDRGHRPVVLRRHRQAQPRQRVAGRGVPRQRRRAGGHAADRGRRLRGRAAGRRERRLRRRPGPARPPGARARRARLAGAGQRRALRLQPDPRLSRSTAGASPARSRGSSPATATAGRASPRASGRPSPTSSWGWASSCSSAATRAAGSGGSSWAGSWASRRPARSSRAASPSAWRA